jgi:hypothetical protein
MKQMKYILLFNVLLFASMFSFANRDLEIKAEKAYEVKNYKEAILAYETILKEGLTSYKLYYNLGNAYFKNNELGKAIYNYELANKLQPNNKDVKTNLKIANEQFSRFEKLYKDGFKSQTELETRKLTLQRTQANVVGTQQKLLQSRNDILDARVEYSAVVSKFRDEVSKAESDKFTALSSMYEAEVDVTKLQGKVASYSIRNGMYYVLAPQDGVVTKVLSSGIGETIKQGEAIATIMPSVYDLVVEIHIKPVDLPLVKKGDKARLQFDGWPAIVFSGWPNASYGTFDGEVFAVDNFADEEGRFRVLIAPNKKLKPWPKALRVGGGTNSIILLNNVPIGYELWRLINGFPPQFYKQKQTNKSSKK